MGIWPHIDGDIDGRYSSIWGYRWIWIDMDDMAMSKIPATQVVPSNGWLMDVFSPCGKNRF
jgi:hypothetical protein